ncbi:MAG: hypothetical protein HY597_02050 [Candidatus Omnitrophica bacterium]|nr:hypothetical protein [Candidatus Omnitrophota bacterium]
MTVRLHPLTVCCVVGSWALCAMCATHPLYVGLLLAATLVLLAATRALAAWRTAMAWSALAAAGLVIINPLVASYGTTLLWSGPRLPVLGHIAVSLEEVAFGLVMGLKLLLLMSLVCLYDRLQGVDELIAVGARVAPKTAMLLTLATLVLPRFKRDAQEIRHALMARGARFSRGPWLQRLRQAAPVFRILLLSSLEGSWATAEALQARGFGAGPRTSFEPTRWASQDTLVAGAALLGLALSVTVLVSRHASYQFYPTLAPLLAADDLQWWLAWAAGVLGLAACVWREAACRS